MCGSGIAKKGNLVAVNVKPGVSMARAVAKEMTEVRAALLVVDHTQQVGSQHASQGRSSRKLLLRDQGALGDRAWRQQKLLRAKIRKW